MVSTLQGYLQPVQLALSTPVPHLSKYELFSIKLLKQCIGCLPDTHDSNKQRVLLGLSDQCCTALQLVQEVSNSGKPKLTFSKLLLHLAKACMCIGETNLGVSYCSMLNCHFTKLNTTGTEGSVLLKQAFELQWSASNEQIRKGCSWEDCLELRKKALQSLLSCNDCDIVYTLQAVMKAEHCFTGTVSLSTTSQHVVDVLHSFHSTLIPTPADILHHQSLCDKFVPIAQYLLHRVVLAARAGREESGGEELMELSAAMRKKHQQVCSSPHHWPVCVQGEVVWLWKSIMESSTQRYVSQ